MVTDINKKRVVAIGKFDGVHLGHRLLIETASTIAKSADMTNMVYVVAPASGKCLTGWNQKEVLLKECGADLIVRQELTDSFRKYTPEQFVEDILLKQLNAGYVVVGYNFRFGINRSGDVNILTKLCAQNGIKTTVIDGVSAQNMDGIEEAISSTRIKKLLDEGSPRDAAECLGRYYSIEGEISEGKHLGRKLGFPTINIYPDDNVYIPKFGVYAVRIHVCGNLYRAVTNIGINPTVDTGNNVKIESHILNYSGESLYGEKAVLEFVGYVRPEIKFSDVDELKMQIDKDKHYIESLNDSL